MFPWVVDSTKDVINALREKTILRTDPVWIVMGDVESFYTNVQVPEAIRLIRTKAYGSPIDKLPGLSRELVADLLEVVMACNCFGFNEKFFNKTHGTAMGTSCAPSFANVAFGFKEEGLLDIIESLGKSDGLILYRRYIDDILLVYKGTHAALLSLLDKMSRKFEPFKIGWEGT